VTGRAEGKRISTKPRSGGSASTRIKEVAFDRRRFGRLDLFFYRLPEKPSSPTV